jgi:hypothetical protein
LATSFFVNSVFTSPPPNGGNGTGVTPPGGGALVEPPSVVTPEETVGVVVPSLPNIEVPGRLFPDVATLGAGATDCGAVAPNTNRGADAIGATGGPELD